MAKKKSPRKTSSKKKASSKPTSPGQKEDLAGAEEQLQFAREQLRHAEEYYEEMKEKAAEQIQQLRETTLDDVVAGVLEFVKKHPAAGVVGAATLGFLFGRISRR